VAEQQSTSFGELLRVRRLGSGLTQEMLAERSGLGLRSIRAEVLYGSGMLALHQGDYAGARSSKRALHSLVKPELRINLSRRWLHWVSSRASTAITPRLDELWRKP
jgi:hypothetical protein